MKNLIILVLLAYNINIKALDSIEYIDGVTYVSIVVKQESNILQSIPSSISDINDTLDNIASSLQSEALPLSNIFSELPSIETNSTYLIQKELEKYRTIKINTIVTKDEILEAIERIQQLDNVEEVYIEPKAELAVIDSNITALPSISNSSTGNYLNLQGYLNSAPLGIDAKYSWTQQGGKGDEVHIIDIEYAWRDTHEDFPSIFTQLGGTYNSSVSARNHGTAVLGVVGASENGFGTTGISPHANIGTSTVIYVTYAQAIINAANALGEGDVIIIELQQNGQPIEYYSQNFNAVRYAVSKGITVVEAAGNGGYNLDSPSYNNKFNRSTRDSGAILVAASNSTGRTPTSYTCYGSRIDLHAWGWNVVSLGGQGYNPGNLFNGGSEDRWYTKTFAGTSSASPIVAGAVANLQGVAKAKIGRFLTPIEVRNILSSTATPQTDGFSKRIAGQPNLRSAIAHLPTAQPIPSEPSNIILSSVTDTQVILKWSDNSNNETGYKIYKDSTLIATLPANTTSYTINNLTEDTTYTYTIKAFNSLGESSPLTITFKTDKNLAWLIPAIYYPILLGN